jgi:hypothetical protein
MFPYRTPMAPHQKIIFPHRTLILWYRRIPAQTVTPFSRTEKSFSRAVGSGFGTPTSLQRVQESACGTEQSFCRAQESFRRTEGSFSRNSLRINQVPPAVFLILARQPFPQATLNIKTLST